MKRAAPHRKIRPWVHLCRLHNPMPLLFFFFPCIWGNLLVHHGVFHWWEACFFLAGCVWARSAGCAINDYMDHTIDEHVARTKNRPLACEDLSPHQVQKSFFFFGVIGLFFLFMCPPFLRPLAIISAGATILYPLCKKFFPFPQLFLGLTINCGALMSYGWSCPLWWTHCHIWLLYGYAVLWTLEYDTLYAYQDLHDDCALKLHSLPVLLGENPQIMKCFFRLGLLLRSCLMALLHGKITCFPLLLLWVITRWNTFSHLPCAHTIFYKKAFHRSLWEGALLSILLIFS